MRFRLCFFDFLFLNYFNFLLSFIFWHKSTVSFRDDVGFFSTVRNHHGFSENILILLFEYSLFWRNMMVKNYESLTSHFNVFFCHNLQDISIIAKNLIKRIFKIFDMHSFIQVLNIESVWNSGLTVDSRRWGGELSLFCYHRIIFRYH